jgi:tRNA(Ile)-lysidine synthase
MPDLTAVFAAKDSRSVSFSAASLGAVLGQLVPPDTSGLVVGLSGGLDSSCLATALVQLAALPVRAVHIDHGLQPASSAFREHSAALCRRLGIELAIVAVPNGVRAGESIEAAAREARYLALAAELARGECLVTAHHCEDQAETFLLQALRGAGPKGLGSMPPRRPLGAGWHLRPLLGVARRDLRQFAAEHGIEAVEDPMNRDARFDRSYLRHGVWPRLEHRWPGAARALARAAQHSADAQALLDVLADDDLAGVRDGEALSIVRLRRLQEVRRLNVLRRWLNLSGAVPPSTARLTEALRQMLGARADHLPVVAWSDYALRRYRDRVFLTPAVTPRLRAAHQWNWRADPVLELGEGLGRLRAISRGGGLALGEHDGTLLVRARAGGECMRIGPQRRARSVQHLCQSRGILPWLRDALPYIYLGEELLAIGDLWTSAPWQAPAAAPGVAFAWESSPHVC